MAQKVKKTQLQLAAIAGVSMFNVPKIKLYFPSIRAPQASVVFALVFLSYFIISSGIIYDVVNEVPSMGVKIDEYTGAQKPVAIMENRLNGQYIIEGFSAGAMFICGALGWILIDNAAHGNFSVMNRNLVLLFGLICVL